jgi:cysteine-rich repeat protein
VNAARIVAAGTCLALALAGSARAATVTVLNRDAAGEGFNDPTPRAPVGGNPGTTLGAQRLAAFQYAADLWGTVLSSDVPIVVEAAFDPLSCGASSATLGSAGPNSVHRDFAGAPRPATWYNQALANRLAGVDLSASADIGATFNSTIGTTCSFPKVWYYGFDASPPVNQIDFVTVVLHEIGHGLGFLSLVSLAGGTKWFGFDDAYMVHLEDHSVGLGYPATSNAQRAAAALDTGDLHWTGPIVVAGSGDLTDGVGDLGHVEMYAPNPAQSGSSVSHFSTALSPNEIMEPSYTTANHDLGRTRALMEDLGWGTCGNGELDAGEECDDGNTVAADCCSALCTLDDVGTACEDGDPCTKDDVCDGAGSCTAGAPAMCDDGNPCTDDACTPGVGCESTPNSNPCDDPSGCAAGGTCSGGTCVGVPTPATGCLLETAPFRGLIDLHDKSPDSGDRFTWKWAKGEETLPAQLGDPLTTTGYELCVFDESAPTPALVLDAHIPPGGTCNGKPCWELLGTPLLSQGYKYKDGDDTPDGVDQLLLKVGDAGRAKVTLKGKGAFLPLPGEPPRPPALPLGAPLAVRVQLLADNGTCWESSFSPLGLMLNTASHLKGRSQ